MVDDTNALLRRILVVNLLFLFIAAAAAVAVVPALRDHLRRSGHRSPACG